MKSSADNPVERLLSFPGEDKRGQISNGRKRYTFKACGNTGAGDCLFLTLAEFLKKFPPHLKKDAQIIREEIVSYIVGFDSADESINFESVNNSVWSKYRQGVKIALEKHVSFFRSYSLEEEDEEMEARARQEYKCYMSQPHVYGTYVELCAAMEKYEFHTTLVEQTQSSSIGNEAIYNICHLDVESSRNIRRRAYIAFTGCIDAGHFEYLEPIKPKRPTIPKGLYQVERQNNEINMLTLVSVPRSKNDNDGPKPPEHTKPNNCLKRPSFPKDSSDSALFPKKVKYLDGISKDEFQLPTLNSLLKEQLYSNDKTLLFQSELETLVRFYTTALSKLKEDFERTQSNENDWPGVSHSEVEKFGPFQTVFFEFEAKAFICLSPMSSNLYAIVYHNKVLSVDEFEASGEHICQKSLSQEFVLEPGKLYSLENHTQELILVRFLWTDCTDKGEKHFLE